MQEIRNSMANSAISNYTPIEVHVTDLLIFHLHGMFHSFWIVRPSKLKEQPKEQPKETYEVHEGMEEGVYIVKGRGKLLTPNESATLEQGGCAWTPAGMPHRAEVHTV